MALHVYYTGCLNTSLDIIAIEPLFGEENVTLTVILDGRKSMIHGITYGVEFISSFEEIIISGSKIASIYHVQLTMLYNTEYNLTTFVILCGFESRSQPLSLFYSEFAITIKIM